MSAAQTQSAEKLAERPLCLGASPFRQLGALSLRPLCCCSFGRSPSLSLKLASRHLAARLSCAFFLFGSTNLQRARTKQTDCAPENTSRSTPQTVCGRLCAADCMRQTVCCSTGPVFCAKLGPLAPLFSPLFSHKSAHPKRPPPTLRPAHFAPPKPLERARPGRPEVAPPPREAQRSGKATFKSTRSPDFSPLPPAARPRPPAQRQHCSPTLCLKRPSSPLTVARGQNGAQTVPKQCPNRCPNSLARSSPNAPSDWAPPSITGASLGRRPSHFRSDLRITVCGQRVFSG